MGPREIEAFLTHLAVAAKVSASTQNQAKAALLFLYAEVLGMDVGWLQGVTSAKSSRRLPVVLTEEEVRASLARLEGVHRLLASLMYGAGLRLMERSGFESRMSTLLAARSSCATGRAGRIG